MATYIVLPEVDSWYICIYLFIEIPLILLSIGYSLAMLPITVLSGCSDSSDPTL